MKIGLSALAFLVIATLAHADPSGKASAASSEAVTTYHYDTLRTGWNSNETTLSAANFPSNFGILQTVQLDDQVDAQPLVVPAQNIAGGIHNVVYVATESNSVYAIDASTGAILLQRNLGSPVLMPLHCNNNGLNVGINSTPVIDLAKQELFVIAYLSGPNPTHPTPTHKLHALQLSTLADAIPPVTVAATHALTDGSTLKFNATYQRQRPALLELNGNIYAGFGSFCDYAASFSRGWVLGWNANTLTPLPTNQLNDMQATSPTSFFLSSVWMSGYGIAGTMNGGLPLAGGESGLGSDRAELFFSTGNSDCTWLANPEACPSHTTYDGVTHIQESVVRLNGNLTRQNGVVIEHGQPVRGDIFTPSNVAALDYYDYDLGSGGVLLLPNVSGSIPFLAVAGGKGGKLFLLDRSNMSTPLDTQSALAECWCGPSYFLGSDGINRVVTSHGSQIQTWQVQVSPSPHLVAEGAANIVGGSENTQDPGFFTSISSNGVQPGTAIIWAVGRPGLSRTVTLSAYAATVERQTGDCRLLYSSPAGPWPNVNANANIVPVVANGKVYVAANQTLTIFGANGQSVAQIAPLTSHQLAPASPDSPHMLTGTLLSVSGSTLTFRTRTGQTVKIDDVLAVHDQQVAPLRIGGQFTALGSSFNSLGDLQATAIGRAKGSPELWLPDR